MGTFGRLGLLCFRWGRRIFRYAAFQNRVTAFVMFMDTLLHKGVAILSMLMFTGCPFGSFRISAVLCMFRVMLAQPRMDGGRTRFHRKCRNARHRKNHCRRQ